jgi:hypothetical protein
MRLFEVPSRRAGIFEALKQAVAEAERAKPGVTRRNGWRSATVERFRLYGVGRSTLFHWLIYLDGPGRAASAAPVTAVLQVAPPGGQGGTTCSTCPCSRPRSPYSPCLRPGWRTACRKCPCSCRPLSRGRRASSAST